MIRILALILCLVFVQVSLAQNLIPNPDFEFNTAIPSDVGQISLCNDWGNAQSTTETSDYFHVNGGLTADLPNTPVANVSAHSGDAIVGFAACGKVGSNYREYLDVKLTAPLEVGKKYRLTFNITNGHVHDYSFGGFASDKLGVKFSTSRLSQTSDEPLNETPDVTVDEVLFNRSWNTETFVFTASEAAEWLTIGIFGDDTDKQIEFIEGEQTLAEYAYYFLDSFNLEAYSFLEAENPEPRIIKDNTNNSTEGDFPFFVPNAFTPDGDGNNDTFEVISSKSGIKYTVQVFDRWGNQIYSASQGNPVWDGKCKDSICPPDIYIWRIAYQDVDEEDKLVEKEASGTIHLIR